MGLSYDVFTGAFLAKVNEYDFMQMEMFERQEIVDGCLKRAVSEFRKNCKYDLFSTADDVNRVFNIDIANEDIDELVNIISEGMLMQWMKPFVYRQENLSNVLNTADFTTYSPAELLLRVGNAYDGVKKDYIQMIREYSYNHGKLDELHI